MVGAYILKHGIYEDTVKIGRSMDPKKRIQTLNTSLLSKDRFKALIFILLPLYRQNIANCDILEKNLHYYFCDKRIEKEREFFKGVQITKELKEYLEQKIGDIEYSDKITTFTNLQESEDIVEKEQDYSYQIPIVEEAVKFYQKENKGGIFIPTGAGKTYIGSEILSRLKCKNICILVPKILISTEWLKPCKRYFSNIVIVNHENNDTTYLDEDMKTPTVYICTYQSMIKFMKEREFKKPFDMIIYDECHHIMSDNSFAKTKNLSCKRSLYMTATPRFISENEEVFDDIRNEVKQICLMTVHEAIDKDILCEYSLCLTSDDTVKNVEMAVDKYERTHILIFSNSIKRCKELYKNLSDIYENVYIVSNEEKHNNKTIREFEKNGGILCNVHVVSEGVSIPKIDCIVFDESRHSQENIVQIIGRGLRKYSDKYLIVMLPYEMDVCFSAMFIQDKCDGESIRKRVINESEVKMKELVKDIKRYSHKITLLQRNTDTWTYRLQCMIKKEKEGVEFDKSEKNWISQQLKKYNKKILSKECCEKLLELEYWRYKIENYNRPKDRQTTEERIEETQVYLDKGIFLSQNSKDVNIKRSAIWLNNMTKNGEKLKTYPIIKELIERNKELSPNISTEKWIEKIQNHLDNQNYLTSGSRDKDIKKCSKWLVCSQAPSQKKRYNKYSDVIKKLIERNKELNPGFRYEKSTTEEWIEKVKGYLNDGIYLSGYSKDKDIKRCAIWLIQTQTPRHKHRFEKYPIINELAERNRSLKS